MLANLNFNGNKGFRLLNIYERLNKGEIIKKSQIAIELSVSEKSIQRDIEDLRTYLAEVHSDEGGLYIKYDKTKNGYYLVRLEREWLTNEEVLVICKIILESRAFNKNELNNLINKLLVQATPEDRKIVKAIIGCEYSNYVPLKHNKELLKPIWILSTYILNQEIVSFDYIRQDGIKKSRTIKPVSIMFSEYYFYLVGYMAKDTKERPIIFRIDRMIDIKGTNKKFVIPYKEKFNDGEFRKRMQFMYGGDLQRVVFEFKGNLIEPLLDRLPTAEIIKFKDGIYTIKAEVYGNGIDMWLRSQGELVKRL
jgi:predicted DNA-binding transcriptional regulator YafY